MDWAAAGITFAVLIGLCVIIGRIAWLCAIGRATDKTEAAAGVAEIRPESRILVNMSSNDARSAIVRRTSSEIEIAVQPSVPSQRTPVSDLTHLREAYAARRVSGPLYLTIGSVVALVGITLVVANAHVYTVILGIVLGFVGILLGASGYCDVRVPLRWYCPNFDCGKLLHSNEPWKCGFCDAANKERSLLNRCGNTACLTPPKACVCKHCGTVMFLDRDNDARHAARSLDALAVPTKLSGVEDVRVERQLTKEAKKHEIEMLELEIELKKKRLMFDPPKHEPVNRAAQRHARLSEQIAMAVQDCNSIKECERLRKQFINDISTNPDYADVKDQVCGVITRAFDDIRIQIEGGDIKVY